MDGLFPQAGSVWKQHKGDVRYKVIFSEPQEVVAISLTLEWTWSGSAELFLKQFYQ
jgi:hypothetical protein